MNRLAGVVGRNVEEQAKSGYMTLMFCEFIKLKVVCIIYVIRAPRFDPHGENV